MPTIIPVRRNSPQRPASRKWESVFHIPWQPEAAKTAGNVADIGTGISITRNGKSTAALTMGAQTGPACGTGCIITANPASRRNDIVICV